MDQQPFSFSEVVYYVVVYMVGFFSGVFQTLRNRDYVNVGHAVNIGMVSGFLAFAIVSFIDGHSSDRAGNEFFYLGIAALVGLSVRYQDQLIRSGWKAFAKKYGIETDDDFLKQEDKKPLPKETVKAEKNPKSSDD